MYVNDDGKIVFDQNELESRLHDIPGDELLKMAEDGVICVDEVARLMRLMGLDARMITHMQPHMAAIGATVLDYVRTHPELATEHAKDNTMSLYAQEAVGIMSRLIAEGHITGMMLAAYMPPAAPDTPTALAHDTKDRHA